MTKDRLAELQRRRSFSVQSGADNPIAEPEREVLIPMENKTKSNEFFIQIGFVRTMIDRISELSDEIKNIHLKIIQPLSDPKLSQTLEEKREDVKKLANEVQTKLKKLEKEFSDEKATRQQTSNDRIRQLQIFNSTHQFREIMARYNTESIVHRDRCFNLIRKELEIAGCRVSDDEINNMINEGFTGRLTTTLLIDVEKAKNTLRNIESRHNEILQLEKSIKELHDMFIDLQTLVATQGEMIDSIEYNVVNTVECTEKGAVHLDKARKNKNRQRKTKIIVSICLIILVIVIIILIFSYVRLQTKFLGR